MMLPRPSESRTRISPVGGLLMCVIPLLLNPLIAAHVDTHVSIRPSSPSCSSLCPRLLGTPSTRASIALEPRSPTHVPVIPVALKTLSLLRSPIESLQPSPSPTSLAAHRGLPLSFFSKAGRLRCGQQYCSNNVFDSTVGESWYSH